MERMKAGKGNRETEGESECHAGKDAKEADGFRKQKLVPDELKFGESGAPNFEDSPSRKHRPGPPNSKDELHSPPGNGAEKWRRDGHNGMGGQLSWGMEVKMEMDSEEKHWGCCGRKISRIKYGSHMLLLTIGIHHGTGPTATQTDGQSEEVMLEDPPSPSSILLPPSPSSLHGSDWSLGGSRDRNCVVLVTRPLRLEPAIKPRSLTQACQMGCQMRFGVTSGFDV
ncbi:hypothetical protein F7725_002130 [Dissostichus mawsoni]|uniref:Uncharacterized protein n=1 Tax=Dissostichus mawsoni TaxID=36200 RepID=A0A7J5Y2M9_DISMA|nr:hypothetical protein F7725_002130 [Dissostichus mawsoni]